MTTSDLILIFALFISSVGVWAMHMVAHRYVGLIGMVFVFAAALYGNHLYWNWEAQRLMDSDLMGNRYAAAGMGLLLMKGLMIVVICMVSIATFVYKLLARFDK